MAFGSKGYEPIDPVRHRQMVQDFKVPQRSDFYRLKQTGRTTLPEYLEPQFVERFAEATRGSSRDYRSLIERFYEAMKERGYNCDSTDTLARNCRVLNIETRTFAKPENAAVLYSDVFVAAVLACPVSEKNVYE